MVAANQFRQVAKIVRKFKREDWFHCLCYEDLIRQPDAELEALTDFLGVSGNCRVASDYSQRIPAAQKHLHQNIDYGPMESRIDAWRSELPTIETGIIESIAAGEMDEFGFERVYSRRRAWALSLMGGHFFGERLVRTVGKCILPKSLRARLPARSVQYARP